jgi:regulator of protease activity HflC (stomatin/prohibitin superfamily)
MTQTEVSTEIPLTWRQRWADRLSRAQFVIYTSLVICLLLLGLLWPRMFVIVPPGHLGVMYRTMKGGTVTDRTWGEGLHVIPSWDSMTLYEVRLQQRSLPLKVLSDEGLSLGIQVVVRFRPREELLGHLHQDIGPDYFDRLVRPEIESHVRKTFGSRPAHEIYATVRDVLQELGQFPLLGRADKAPGTPAYQPYLHVQDLKLVIIELPKVVEDAIVEKYHQEQLMLAYRYKLEREQKEAERKRTEAAGIRDFSQIAGKNAELMLRWRGLEVTSEFAKSPNAKLVVIGGAQSNLPLMLNVGDMGSAAPPAPPAPAPIGEPPAPAEAVEKPAAKPPARPGPVRKAR